MAQPHMFACSVLSQDRRRASCGAVITNGRYITLVGILSLGAFEFVLTINAVAWRDHISVLSLLIFSSGHALPEGLTLVWMHCVLLSVLSGSPGCSPHYLCCRSSSFFCVHYWSITDGRALSHPLCTVRLWWLVACMHGKVRFGNKQGQGGRERRG